MVVGEVAMGDLLWTIRKKKMLAEKVSFSALKVEKETYF